MRVDVPKYRIGETVYFIRAGNRSIVGSRIIYIEWHDINTRYWHEYHLDQWMGGFKEDQLFATLTAAVDYIIDKT